MAVRSVLLAVCALAIALTQSAQAQTSQEDVKATFVYRFASFVGWPQAAFADEAAPVSVCVIGADPVARALRRATTGQRAGARGFDVRRLSGADDIDGCHVLYVVGDRTQAALRATRGRPVLIITDSLSGRDRGVIHFALVDNRVRFYIDDAMAAENGLSIDPRLLSLALAVRRRPMS